MSEGELQELTAVTREERILAYADGELDPAARRVLELEMQIDPTLAAQVAAHVAVRGRSARTYAAVRRKALPARFRRASRLPIWAAMAACLLVGVLAGQALPERGPFETGADGTLIARGDLAAALDTQLTGDAGAVRIGLSFRDRDGRLCRTFQSLKDGLSGLACREGATWAANAIVRDAQPSAMPAAVLAAVDPMIVGEALDRDAEAAARARSWRP